MIDNYYVALHIYMEKSECYFKYADNISRMRSRTSSRSIPSWLIGLLIESPD